MQSSEQLRLKARQCRRLAASTDDARARDALNALADQVEAQLERSVRDSGRAQEALAQEALSAP